MELPTFVDSSMLERYTQCPRRFWWEHCRNLRPAEPNWHLIAGRAMAEGLQAARVAWLEGREDWREAGLLALTRAYGPGDSPIPAKTWLRVATAFACYWDKWPPDSAPEVLCHEGVPMVEFTFSLPLEVSHPATRQPIMYCGRCDWLATFHGQVFVVDEKTTSSLGSAWADKWPLRGQFLGYLAAARAYGFQPSGMIVRGIALTAQPTFAESINPVPHYRVERWWEWVNTTVEELVRQFERGRLLQVYNDQCTLCPYSPLCRAKDAEPLTGDYVETKWDPLHH